MSQNVKISKEKQYCYISFCGETKEEYSLYVDKLLHIQGLEWSIKHKSWRCPENAIEYVTTLFNNDMSIEDMGKGLKLEPYPYQKQLIYDIITHKELLLISPCGSGKTPIGIGAFVELRDRGIINQYSIGIILVKATLKLQWLEEIKKFSDLKATVIKSYADICSGLKTKIKNKEKRIKKLDVIKDKAKIIALQKEIEEIKEKQDYLFDSQFRDNNLLILNYEALKDINISNKLKTLNIEYIYADEIQKISNRKTDLSKAACEFNYIKYKAGATATAIGRDVENIYALFNFISPQIFPSYSTFSRNFVKYAGFGRVIGAKNEDLLVSKYQNNIVVLTKNDVAKHLPKLSVIQQYCEMTEDQEKMNCAIMEELKEAKNKEFELSNKAQSSIELENNEEYQGVTAKIMMLQTFAQELCNDPRLLKNSSSKYAEKYLPNNLRSPKTEMALELVSDIINSGEKVIIISRYVNMLNILENELKKHFGNINIAKVTGSMNDEERYNNIYTKFRDNPEYKILLMSDAGSTGTNASTAQYIIEFDLAESYATQTQRHGRIERADSIHENVFVYQLIAKNSYDEIQQLVVNKKEAYDSNLIKVFAK